MKDKKTIAYKKDCSKKIAYNLRGLLTKVVMQEWSLLGTMKREKGKTQLERTKIENVRSDLYRALDASICICPCCNQIDRDMMYNAYLEEWYCTLCVQGYIDFYNRKKSDIDTGGLDGDSAEKFYESFQ